MGSWLSVLEVGKNYKLRYHTKEEFVARVTGETSDAYLLTLRQKCSFGDYGDEVNVPKRFLKLLEEAPA